MLSYGLLIFPPFPFPFTPYLLFSQPIQAIEAITTANPAIAFFCPLT